MPMVRRGQGEFKKIRGIISGFSGCGKTYNIRSFIEEGKSLVALICPGETGVRSLPEDGYGIESIYYSHEGDNPVHSVEWSREAIHAFDSMYIEIERNKPDKLFIDGLHHLYAHDFNIITGGEFLAGVDMSMGAKGFDPYRSAKFYNMGHTHFGQRLAGFNVSPIEFIVVTTLEEWQASKTEGERGGDLRATRYLWPDLPGQMATRVVSKFDFRLSARLEVTCIHPSCEDSKEGNLHFVWQFAPKNDVMGVAIKGLDLTQSMMKRPWIHQTYGALQNLMKRVS